MREIERIDRILNELRKLWKKVPDWRFNQLLINLAIIPDGIYWGLEDEFIEKLLKKQKVIKNE